MRHARFIPFLAATAVFVLAPVAFVACDAATQAQSAAPTLVVEPATLDMGDLVPEVPVTRKVKLTNRSDKPIRIANSVADCSCTTPTHPGEPIAPGATVETDITMKAGPKQGVTLTKRVTFQLESGELAFLSVVGKVGLFIEQSTELLRAPANEVAEPGSETITLRGADNTPFAIKAVDPAVSTPATAESAMQHALAIDWAKWREAGKPTKISILTDHPKTPELVVMVRRTVAAPAPVPAAQAKTALPPATLTIAPAEGRRIRQYKVELPTVFPGATVGFPPFGRFIKGNDIRAFQPGRVLVVEFFSTTCGHCKEAKPQIEALVEAFGPQGFDFVAVTNEEAAKITEWLEKPENSEGLTWSIAIDPESVVQRALQNPTFQVSNPRMFVIKDGTVLWYGHPDQAEGPMSQIAAGTWDPATIKDEFVKNALVTRARENATKLTKQCEKDGKWQDLLTLFEAIAVALPDSASTFEVQRFGTMIGQAGMPVEGYAYGRKLGAYYAKDIATLRSIARTTLNSPSVQVRDLDFALDLAQKADALGNGQDARAAEVLALAYFSKGDRDNAILHQERAIGLQTIAKVKVEYEKQLAKYRKDEPKPVPYTPRPGVTATKPSAPAGAGASSSADGADTH